MVKGYLYSMEVFITLAVVVVSIILVYRTAPVKPDQSYLIMEKQVSEVLNTIQKDNMNKIIYKNNETAIEDILNNTLLANIKYDAVICRFNCDSEFLPTKKGIRAFTVYSSGYLKYKPKKLKVYIWKKY